MALTLDLECLTERRKRKKKGGGGRQENEDLEELKSDVCLNKE